MRMMKMTLLRGVVLLYLSLSLSGGSSALSCRWMEHKFRQFSQTSLDLLDTMAHNSTNSTEEAEDQSAVSFPDDLYNQASRASAADKLVFTVQTLEEVVSLFEEDHSSASWEENEVEPFVSVVTQQAEGLRSCIQSHGHRRKHTKLHLYFKRLCRHVLRRQDHSAEAWELIRREIQTHLMRADQLVSSLLPSN